jgi:hypothetical protein
LERSGEVGVFSAVAGSFPPDHALPIRGGCRDRSLSVVRREVVRLVPVLSVLREANGGDVVTARLDPDVKHARAILRVVARHVPHMTPAGVRWLQRRLTERELSGKAKQ